MSLTKIPIRDLLPHDGPFERGGVLIADMMCSENITTNALLEDIGRATA